MKRIQSACLAQTLIFKAKDDSLPLAERSESIAGELAHYKAQLERARVRCVIDEEAVQPDGSIILKIRKQYLNHDCGRYLE